MLGIMTKYGTDSGRVPLDDRYWQGHSMMWFGQNQGFFWIHALMAIITWVLIIAILFALARWVWKKGDKVK